MRTAGCVRQVLDCGRRELLVVVVRARRLRSRRPRVAREEGEARLVEFVRRDLVIRERLTGGPVDERHHWVAVLVDRLAEVARALELGRDLEPDGVAVVDLLVRRTILVGVEEEQLVVPARLAYGTTDRVPVDVALVGRLRVAVLRVDPAVLVPVRVDLDVVGRSAETVRAGLRDGRDLEAARPSVFRLIPLREHLDLGDRLDVHVEHLAVVAGVHRRDAVHHDVVLADAAEAGAAGRRAERRDARRERGEGGEVPVVDRQVLDFRRGNCKGALTGGGLNQRRL